MQIQSVSFLILFKKKVKSVNCSFSWTLFFKNPSVEREYRRTAWRPRTGGSDPHRASVTVQAAAADNASSSAVTAPPSGDAAYYQQVNKINGVVKGGPQCVKFF